MNLLVPGTQNDCSKSIVFSFFSRYFLKTIKNFPDVFCLSVTPPLSLSVTLADKDTNSIPADNADRAIQGNVAMQVTQVVPSGGQIWN